MSVVQLLGTLRNKLLCTLRHLRQQLRHSLRASEIRLRRTVRTDFLLRVPAASPRAPRPVEHLRQIGTDQITALVHAVRSLAAKNGGASMGNALRSILIRLVAYLAVAIAAGLLFLAGATVYQLIWPRPVVPLSQMSNSP